MPGCRRVILPAAFLGFAVLFTGGDAARAQTWRSNSSHEIWNDTLTPDEVKKRLARLGEGGGNLGAFEDQIQKLLKQRNPEFREEDIRKALDFLKKNPQLLEDAKKFAKQRQTDPGRPGQLTPEDLAKLFKTNPGDPKQPIIPTKPDDSKIDPKNPTDPGTPTEPKQPDDPRPVEPVQPVDPDTPRPMPGTPVNPQNPPKTDVQPRRSVDDTPFPAPDEEGSKPLDALASLWERNIGPLSENPEVREALFNLLNEADGLDLDMFDSKGNSFWDLLKNGDSAGLNDFFNGEGLGGSGFGGGSGWKLPDWEFPKFNWGGRGRDSGSDSGGRSWFDRDSSPRTPRDSSSSGSGLPGFSFGGSWAPVVLLGLVIFGALLWFWLKNVRFDRGAGVALAGNGLGPWPVDPRAINTREDVVKAFEYLSVLICGPAARNWTHGTIAEALSELAATRGEAAVMLARLYELARYAPLDEPLSRDELIEARQLVCSLAGVSY